MKKRDVLKSSLAALALGGPVTALRGQHYPESPSESHRNLLLITADDIDWSCLGFMTGQEGITPNLDRLAARSHRFRQMRTSSPICMPSRQAFMSGLRPHRNGGNGFFAMNEGTPTIASRLSDAGWFVGATHKISHMLPASSFPWNFKAEGKDRHPELHGAGLDLIIREARAIQTLVRQLQYQRSAPALL
ncbi:sulfatase-like hydrolase/transferase [Altericroceibacterium spongiae]|nr:sulfatase-like hydrolase/transferase [Altericroceibacterium spongiae]